VHPQCHSCGGAALRLRLAGCDDRLLEYAYPRRPPPVRPLHVRLRRTDRPALAAARLARGAQLRAAVWIHAVGAVRDLAWWPADRSGAARHTRPARLAWC